jgi:hypothetical protein
MKGVDGAGWPNGRRVTEVADQKEMIADNDRSAERWTFIHFA